MGELVSVIMSAYNAEKTITKAIDSVIKQTYTNWELIVVNDCSTDNTEDIIKGYTSADSRIKLVNHDINKGCGEARYTGISKASGDYIMFVDSDDWIDFDFMSTMIPTLDESTDIVYCGVRYINDKNELVALIQSNYNLIYTKESKYNNLNISDPRYYIWNAIFKKKLFNNVEYCRFRFIEDTGTNFKLQYYADNIKVLSYCGYNYFQREDSLINASSKFKRDLYTTVYLLDMVEWKLENKISIHLIDDKVLAEYLNNIQSKIVEDNSILQDSIILEGYEIMSKKLTHINALNNELKNSQKIQEA